LLISEFGDVEISLAVANSENLKIPPSQNQQYIKHILFRPGA